MITEFAPAKVNLYLRVGARREDGFHPLDSLAVFADWGDWISADPDHTLFLEIRGEAAAALDGDTENLVLKVGRALRAAAERPELGARLRLQKTLPVAAGLGGGSADAAAALCALNRLWDLGFSLKALAAIGAEFGSDIPACIYSKPLRMEGRGEAVTALSAWPELAAVILYPGTALSTAEVFAAFDEDGPPALTPMRAPVSAHVEGALTFLDVAGNDLEGAAKRLRPVISDALAAIRSCQGARLARMSGSGSTCFGLFDSLEAAKGAERALNGAKPGWRAKAVTLKGASA